MNLQGSLHYPDSTLVAHTKITINAISDWLERETRSYWEEYELAKLGIALTDVVDCYLTVLQRAFHYPNTGQLPETMWKILENCVEEKFTNNMLYDLAHHIGVNYEPFLRFIARLTKRFDNSQHPDNKHIDSWNHWDLLIVLNLVEQKYIVRYNTSVLEVPKCKCQQLLCRVIQARNDLHEAPKLSNLTLSIRIVEGLFAYLYATTVFYKQLCEETRLTAEYRKHLTDTCLEYRKSLPHCHIDISLSASKGVIISGELLSNELIDRAYSSCITVIGDSGAGKSTLRTYLIIKQYDECLNSGGVEEPLIVDPTSFTEKRGLIECIATAVNCSVSDVERTLGEKKRCLFIDRIDQLGRQFREHFVSDVAHLLRNTKALTIVIFSRIHIYCDYYSSAFEGRIESNVFSVEPLTNDQISRILELHGINDIEPYLTWIKDSTRPDMFATPHSISMLAQVGLSEAIRSQDDLTRIWCEKRVSAEAKVARILWSHCCEFLALLSRSDSIVFGRDHLYDVIKSLRLPSETTPEKLLEQTLNSGILQKTTELKYEFSHSRFREYFASVLR